MKWGAAAIGQNVFNIQRQEIIPLLWSLLYVLALFLAYYALRPVRDAVAASSGVRNLPWLFTGTLLTMLVVSPLFAALVKRFPRQVFISITYRFFASNLLLFAVFLYFTDGEIQRWVERTFFIWLSVFNLFVVSVFWSLMVDIWNNEQSKRLFALLAAGATAGGLFGSIITKTSIAYLDRAWLMLIAIVFLEIALLATRRLIQFSSQSPQSTQNQAEEHIGGSTWAGLSHTLSNPYLAGIALFILFSTVTATLLYFQAVDFATKATQQTSSHIQFFANIDLWVNAISLVLQVFFTSRLIKYIGITAVLCFLPLVTLLGFAYLALAPSMLAITLAQIARRIANFALARPVREILFTACSREDRYKAKNFIDTVVYRSGDQIGSWGYFALLSLGLAVTQIPLLAMVLCVAWLINSMWLGRQHAV